MGVQHSKTILHPEAPQLQLAPEQNYVHDVLVSENGCHTKFLNI